MNRRTEPARTDVDPSIPAVRRLTALRTGHDHGWFRYAGGVPRTGHHLVAINGRWRLIGLDPVYYEGRSRLRITEAYWWVRGVGSVHGQDQIDTGCEGVPELLRLPEAAKLSRQLGGPGSEVGLVNRISRGHLYPVYVWATDRRVVVENVRAMAQPDNRQAQDQWSAIRATFPPLVPISEVTGYPGPAPSPDPLPIGAGGAGEDVRRQRAMIIGHLQGWFTYLAATPDGEYLVLTKAHPSPLDPLVLPGRGVLPWVLGVADVHNAAALVAYRGGLG